MKNFVKIFFGSIILIMVFACSKKPLKTNIQPTIEQLNLLSDSIKKMPYDKKLSFWQSNLHKQKNDVNIAFIHYQIAKNFASTNLDSAKYHINTALNLIEKRNGALEQKILIYNGIANIANTEEKDYQAAYYYNKAAAIILADSTINTKPEAKITCLLNATQANMQLRQFKKAIQQDLFAIALLKKSSINPENKFRAYAHLYTCYTRTNQNKDSLKQWIEKIETVAKEINDPLTWRFTNEYKGIYYQKIGYKNLAIEFSEKVKNFDKETLKTSENKLKTSNVSNLYISLSNLIILNTEYKNLALASIYIKEADELQKKYPNSISDYEKELNTEAKADYYYASDEFEKSHNEFDKLISLKNEIASNASIQSMEEMSTMYQLQAKDRSIKSLGDNIHTTSQELQKNRYYLIITILVALLALSLLGFFYYSQKKRNQEKEQTNLQQQLLRTQMEPHFIFNTLSALQSFIRFDEKEKSLKYLNQFSRLLRSSLELSRQNLVSLNEEMETLENYLSLQQMRHNNSFEYKIESLQNTDTSAIMIPPMLIQPFVENAIIHGLDLKNKRGKIEIQLELKERILQVTIQDNGNGFLKTNNNDKQHKSLSGTIAKERLEIFAKEYKLPTNVETYSEKNKGTTVLLTLPVA